MNPVDRPAAELEPVRHRLSVPLPPADAFALFTQSIARWWPFKGHSCSGEQATDVEFEPKVGGAVTEIARDGSRHTWGTIEWWSPPHGFAMTWHPAQDPERATVLSVRFIARGDGCELQLEHGRWGARGEQAAEVRDGYRQGWATVLGRYAACAAEEKR